MPSVTRDKKKYGAPTIYDEKTKKKQRDEITDENFRTERDKQFRDGAAEPAWDSGGIRKTPVRYDE